MPAARPQPTSILDLHRRAGDENVGQTLVRLALLAQAAHQAEVASQIQHSVSHREDRQMCGRIAHKPVIAPVGAAIARAAGPDHTEVAR